MNGDAVSLEEETEESKTILKDALSSKTLKIHDQDFGFVKATDRIIIIGAAGQGKSVTMHYIAEGLHARGAKINMLAPRKVMLLKHQGKLPAWIEVIPYKYPHLESGAMTMYDDAQLRSSAREWYSKKHVDFNKILSLARHKHAGIMITTQETSEIDRAILPKVNYLIIKKPGIFGASMDRPEVRKISMAVRQKYEKEIEGRGLDPRQYNYVISDTWEGWVGPTGTPTYWSSELGDWT